VPVALYSVRKLDPNWTPEAKVARTQQQSDWKNLNEFSGRGERIVRR